MLQVILVLRFKKAEIDNLLPNFLRQLIRHNLTETQAENNFVYAVWSCPKDEASYVD